MDEETIDQFRRILLQLRKRFADNVSHLEEDALRDTGDRAGELSDMPLEHLADRGSETFNKDMLIGILQNSEAELVDIDLALEKIEDGGYGKCEQCGGEIGMERLKALPFARLCIECKQIQEKASD